LNKGIHLARGRYIAINDGDDLSRPDRLRVEGAFLDSHLNIGMVGSFANVIDKHGVDTGEIIHAPTDHDEIKAVLLRFNPFVHSSVMYRAEILKDIGGYSDRFIPGFEWGMYANVMLRTKVANIFCQKLTF